MKKALVTVLLIVTMLSFSSIALAQNTTTLTTTVPAATYTLSIPADQRIEFGTYNTPIGGLTVSNATGFADGKNLWVVIQRTPFTCESVDTTISYSIAYENANGKELETYSSNLAFKGQVAGDLSAKPYTVNSQGELITTDGNHALVDELIVRVPSENWGRALAGEYTATITFAAEVRVEE